MEGMTRREMMSVSIIAAGAGLIAAHEARAAGGEGTEHATDHRIRLDLPAETPLEAMVVGNGRLGAMVMGQPRQEVIPLNEDTLWAGQPHVFDIGDRREALAQVREAVFAEDYGKADELCKRIQGKFSHSYAPMANLHLLTDFDGEVTDYRRELDLDEGVARVSYKAGGVHYMRDMFVSYPAQLVILRLRASQPGKLTIGLRLDSLLQAAARADALGITLEGKAPAYCAPNYKHDVDPVIYSEEPGKGMAFATRLELLSTDGRSRVADGMLHIEGAGEIVLAISGATGFRRFDLMPDIPAEQVLEKALAPCAAARGRKYDALFSAHVADHQALYRRTSLTLGRGGVDDRPADVRLAASQGGLAPSLATLYFNFSRYLLIASSRPGTQAANLQGIWSWELRPPWSSNYTTNINIQQNYWGAEACNLPELAGPMIDFVEEVAQTGAETARRLYGMKGWCVHHNSDLWRLSMPVGEGEGGPTWANFALAGPWLARHVWDHYLYSQDRDFLEKRGYRLLKGCAEFCADWLVRDPRNGHMTTAPSVSTENSFRSADGGIHAVSAGCTMDIAMIREIFAFTGEAAAILGVDADFAAHLRKLADQLPPYKIGQFGQLQEWALDFVEPESQQRHISHLYPLTPGWEITPRSHPDLAKAARVSMLRRLEAGGAGTGWGRAWCVHVFARLGDGQRALENLGKLLETSTTASLLDILPSASGSLFQIDGNFAGGAAVVEMLLQSHAGVVAFLPALPAQWSEGALKGVRARGGLTMDLAWAGGRMTGATLMAAVDGSHVLRPPAGQKIGRVLNGRRAIPLTREGDDCRVAVKAGQRYRLTFT